MRGRPSPCPDATKFRQIGLPEDDGRSRQIVSDGDSQRWDLGSGIAVGPADVAMRQVVPPSEIVVDRNPAPAALDHLDHLGR